MADEESEGDARSKDGSGQLAAPTEQDTSATALVQTNCDDANIVDGHVKSQCENWNSIGAPSAGPRSLLLRRSDNGFGFTLRHFIVYPPESNAILARDRRLGVGSHVVGNEPMDTIFVKHVRENSPASAAGLTTGDRIISVNGEDIAGLSYAKIIQLIHKTGNYLHLLVVPKENDLLQLYFSETAHNPETNQRLHVQSSDSSMHVRKNHISAKPSNMQRYSRSETSPIVPSASGTMERERTASTVRAIETRRSSEGNNERRSAPVMSVCSRRMRDLCARQAISDTSSCGSSESGTGYGYGGAPPACRFSLDTGGGRTNNFDLLSDASVKDSYGSEDSLIMTRLRKSFEQKEEFLNRPLQATNGNQNAATAKEFYSRPQKMTTQPWPPTQSCNSLTKESETTSISDAAVKNQSKSSFISSLDKIQETAPPVSKMLPEGADQPFQMVSVRTKQFEKGAVEDKTELYRSELARLTTKHNVASVAVRKRDFENRAQIERQSFATRETRSLDSASLPTFYSTPGSGNRIIPIGSKHLHCEPPADFSSLIYLDDDLKNDELLLQKNKPVVRQDSYLAACSKPTITITRKADSSADLSATNDINRMSLAKQSALDDDKSTRRISYIKATGGDTMNVDSEYEFSDNEAIAAIAPQRRVSRKWRTPLFPGEIQRLKKFFEDLAATSGERGILGFRKTTDNFPDQDQHNVVKEGALLCKVTQIEGKRAGDRSWKQIWLTLKGPFLYLGKEKRESISVHAATDTPATFDRQDLGASCDRIDIRRSVIEVACDYTKRKHVFRLNAPSVGAELLLQADDATSMTQWVKVLQEQAFIPSSSNDTLSNFSSNVSPNTTNKTFRKFPSLRNRSPTGPTTGDSPGSKAKKPINNETQQSSPKTRTWKNKMAKQFRRIQPGSSSPNTPATVTYPPGATIGIPLELCPSSSFSEYVPLLVEICTNIVEAKGLEIIGIYRVPGNNAAVSSLTEAVNRGLDVTVLEQDSRWSDVNVISSLLKSFFRKLPDALLTSELYPLFIKADRIDDPILRIETLRKLVHDLPDHNFETLRYLLFHLKKVVANASVNKMEARNLAIVFGPTLVRNGDDMVTMVTDMSHQCRIVESLIVHVDWCFGDGNIADLKASIPDINSVPELDATPANHGVLLENIRKVEASMQSPVTAKDIVSTIIGAANRKKQKTSKVSYSTRKTHSLSATISQIGSSSEDILDAGHSQENSLRVRNYEKKDEEKKLIVDQKKECESLNNDMSNSVTIKPVSEEVNKKINSDNVGSNTWTYANLAASTQERIRKFEQETKAMLQRELTRQKRSSDFSNEDVTKERSLIKNKDNSSSEEQRAQLTSSLLSDKCSDKVKIEQDAGVSRDHSICDNPPPVIVMRRNLPNVNGKNVTMNNDNNYSDNNNSNNSLKRLKTSEEYVQNSLAKSSSLDSLNHDGRSSSHVSDDGGDLLVSLTSTFDRKLKSLNKNVETNAEVEENVVAVKKRNSVNDRTIEDSSTFRDPSLHKTLERMSKVIEPQNKDSKTNKENSENDEKKDADEVKDKRSCVTCGCSLKHSETVQQNCDNWRRTVLQETQAENRLQENVRCEPKLFYSNSVKLRRSASLKEDQSAGTKLRRSGSLNKHEPKISKLESWILTRNAEATKLKRNDSLTKSEKTEANLLKRRQMEVNKKARSDKDGGGIGGCGGGGKTKRRTGTKNSNIKRRHTVGGTKDFDKVSWLQNQQRENNKENRKERRTSSPDLSSTRADLLIEVVVRPRSIITIDRNLISRLLNVPLESQV